MLPVESSQPNSLAVLIAARNEADVITDTIGSLRESFPGAVLWVADDASDDGTAEAAMAAGARVVRRGKSHGKGGNMTACAEAMLSDPGPDGQSGGGGPAGPPRRGCARGASGAPPSHSA